MSARQYETYLAQCFIEWTGVTIQSGFRYQFKSPDADNALALYRAFLAMAGSNKVVCGQHELPFIDCNGVQLIPVLHGEKGTGFTENYISHLRDQVASRSGQFVDSALLIIHNSMLDTLINSALDLAAVGAIWHPATLEPKLAELISPGSSNEALSHFLLEDQLALIIDEGATVFGFSPVFHSLDDGVLDFSELGLFDDPMILEMTGQSAQVRRRLDENRALRREIEFSVENYGAQLESVLTKFSPKFISEHFDEKKDWQTLDFDVYLNEISANKTQKLLLDSVECEGAELYLRAKSNTKVGQKEVSVLVQVPTGKKSIELEFKFLGNDLLQEQLVLRHNRHLINLDAVSVSRGGGKYSKAKVTVPFVGTPCFFSIELKRENRAEEYKFRCLLVEQERFYLTDIKHCYRVEPLRNLLTLQLEENQLRVAAKGDAVLSLVDDNGLVDCGRHSVIDFEDLANKSELVQFTVCAGDQQLKINIEGLNAEDGVGVFLPLLFDKERIGKLFRSQGNAEYNRAKHRIVLDNTEHSVVAIRQQLLELEATMVEERLLSVGLTDQLFKLDNLQRPFPTLYQAYTSLFDYYVDHKTLPSLIAWDESYRGLVQHVVDSFEVELRAVSLNQVLTPDQKDLLRVGLHKQDGKERLCPLHPLVLAYHLQLVNAILTDRDENGDTSFSELSAVTLNRLVASGLLPFVYHNESEFAHLEHVKENCFWLELVPQRQVSHTYVRRLVKDKLREFTDAYSRLFTAGDNSALIINAINQGQAEELFLGLVDYFKLHKEDVTAIHVNFYDQKLQQNDFDKFAETGSYDKLKEWLKLNGGTMRVDADMLIDLIRSRLTYSKFVTPHGEDGLAYAHLAFFCNNAPVDCRPVNIGEALSGVLCDGLIAGEAAEMQGEAYFTAFGLRNVEVEAHQALRLARLLGAIWEPARRSNAQYLGQGIGLAVSAHFKQLLTRSYDSALWTTIIDPKVTLDFFTSQKDVVLIHYSDQYTSSAGYDAITVTKQVDLFQRLLRSEIQVSTEHLLAEFNAFNGEWLLKMLTAQPKDRKEKHGIIGAYKFISAMLRRSDICWVPLSVAEMIRVSGNVGLKMSESDFSRYLQGYKAGSISDDVLFVGFKGETLYLLPLEVKTGVRPDYKKASLQAKELKRYLQEDVLGPDTLAARLYRSLFIRQMLMQVEKFRLYHVLSDNKLSALLDHREWWLKGDYEVASVPDYVEGIVLAHVENDSCFEPNYQTTVENVLQIELPYALLPRLIGAVSTAQLDQLLDYCKVPACYLLGSDQVQRSVSAPLDSVSTGTDFSEEIPQEREGTTPTVATEKLARVNIAPAPDVSEVPLRVLYGQDVLRQTPLYWEPTNTARFMNTNTGIIGTMGTGKTQFTKSLVTQLMRGQASNVNGAPIGMLIFDYKSDYVDDAFSETNRIKHLKLHRLPYNPLSLYGNMAMLPVHTATGFAETMARAFGLGQKQQLRLRKLILDAYEFAGISKSDATTWGKPAPTVAQLWTLFLEQGKVEEDSLYAALDSLATYEIFEAHPEAVTSLYDLLDGVTVIDLAGYSPQIQNLVVALTLDLFYSQMQKRGKPAVEGDYRQITKMILVDEADNFMKEDFQSLRKILKEGREYGVGMILSTQEITHFKTGENNYASYVLTWVVHRVTEIKNADIKAIFNKDDKGEQESLMETIRKLDKHYSLYIDGDKRVQKMRDKAFYELDLLQKSQVKS
ncbi:DNA phosphorothioation-dependent restriction protein DptH [Collimonas humicola]|uniref:DNA phosphorothioation-dependent restriction protein DptH n=1 Tax=Collimonas humicola TaxID=2825886 RepID=UPI001B8BD8B9|nr:DNA phosphorothioation-dependent restriction protein DptH [Collimonas humicola]